MVAPVKGKVMVPVVVAPVIKALVARVLVVARRPPQTQLLMTVGKPAPNSNSSRHSRN